MRWKCAVSALDAALQRGINEGINIGTQSQAKKTASLMKAKGYPVTDITELTGLTEAEIISL